jgi:hypothetical protein
MVGFLPGRTRSRAPRAWATSKSRGGVRIVAALGYAILTVLALSCTTDSGTACGNGSCPDGQACVEAHCVTPCTDECSLAGIFACASAPANGLVVCADFDADRCLEWGGFLPCPNGGSCVDSACTGSCSDECPADGELVCDADGYRQCGQQDDDSCLEWSTVTSCPSGETCSNGICSGTCADECAQGEKDCDGGGVRTCGEHDADPCFDWSPVEPCGEAEVCQGGQCSPSGCLQEDEPCVCGENQCCEGHCCPVFFICVSFDPNEDFCPFGPG